MIEFITQNWEGIVAAIGALIALGVAIAKLTPTTKDDTVLGKIKEIFDKLFTKKV